MVDWSSVDLIGLYVDMLKVALPITFVFGVCNLLTDMITRAFFKGRLHFGGRF